MTKDNLLQIVQDAGFEIVDGNLRLYFDGDRILLKPNCMGTVADGIKAFAERITSKPPAIDLTDDEIAEAVGSPLDEVYLADFRAVINAFKEKNKWIS